MDPHEAALWRRNADRFTEAQMNVSPDFRRLLSGGMVFGRTVSNNSEKLKNNSDEPEASAKGRKVLRVHEATRVFDSASSRTFGGKTAKSPNIYRNRIKLAGSTLEFPEEFLTKKRRITLKLLVVKRRQSRRDLKMFFGPEFKVIASAEELSGEENVRATLTVPTCYIRSEAQAIGVEIYESSSREIAPVQFWDYKDWSKLSPTTQPSGEFSFDFRPSDYKRYRFAMEMDGNIEKIVAHMIFAGKSYWGEDILIWCLCDNLMETKLENQKQMELKDFCIIKTEETFRISRDDNIRLTLEISGGEVDDPVQIISAAEIWWSDSIVQAEFVVRGLRAGVHLKYKAEKMKEKKQDEGEGAEEAAGCSGNVHLCVENTFIYPELTAM